LVLHAIALGHGLPVSRKQIVQALGENYLLYDQRRLDTQMHQLRKTIFAASGVDLPVRTARGRGYHFVAEVELK
jgi:DNA-binding response OmpR family regulator